MKTSVSGAAFPPQDPRHDGSLDIPSKFLHTGTTAGLQIGFSGSENDLDICPSINFAMGFDHAADLGTFLIECTPGMSIKSTIHVIWERPPEEHGVFPGAPTVVTEIPFYADDRGLGIVIESKDGCFWLSTTSARELGRVILSLSRPKHEHVSRQEVEKEAAVA